MNNWLVVPLLIPLVTAVVLIFLKRRVKLQRVVSGAASLLSIGAAALLVHQIDRNGIQTLHMGGWAPPYGIVFVADMLAGLLVLATAVVGAACLFYAFGSIGEERERMYAYPLFQFLLTGVYGSFLTGDLFNLFVCFEVMLISSYALIVLGGTKRQLRGTLGYILVNILSSALFVVAIAYLYAVTGTLNMAHLSERVAEVGQGGLLNAIAILLLLVFSLKAGLFLFFWLPGSYSAPPAAIRALFGGLLTKVGLYAIIRTFSLIFSNDTSATHGWIGFMAAATMALGGIGAIAHRDMAKVINYNVVMGVGFIAFGISLAAREAWEGVIFYLLHDMLAKALLFMLGGLIVAAAGTERLREMGGLIKRVPWLGWLFFATALAIVGIPPLSGFPGKMLLIRSGFQEQAYALAGLGVASSLIALYSLLNVFRQAFWGQAAEREQPKLPASESGRTGGRLIGRPAAFAAAGVFVLLLLVGIAAEWMHHWVSQAGATLDRPELYTDAVMKE